MSWYESNYWQGRGEKRGIILRMMYMMMFGLLQGDHRKNTKKLLNSYLYYTSLGKLMETKNKSIILSVLWMMLQKCLGCYRGTTENAKKITKLYLSLTSTFWSNWSKLKCLNCISSLELIVGSLSNSSGELEHPVSSAIKSGHNVSITLQSSNQKQIYLTFFKKDVILVNYFSYFLTSFLTIWQKCTDLLSKDSSHFKDLFYV